MTLSLPRLLSVAAKEVRQLRRDPRMLVLVLLAPLVQLFLFGYAANLDAKDVAVVVVDEDGGPEARRLARALDPRPDREGALAVVGRADRRDVDDLFAAGAARAAVVIPPGFGRAARQGRGEVAVWLDGADSNTATIARADLQQVLAREALALAAAARAGEPATARPVEVSTRVLYNPALRSANFMVPGVTAVILLVTTTMLSAMSIVKEKEAGTYEALLVTPIRPVELVCGKLLPFVVIALLDVALVLGAAVGWFGVPLRGSAALVLLFAAAFVLGSIGLGLLLSTLVSTQRQAMVLTFTLLIPMFLLSGFIFPVSSLPPALQQVSRALPVRYFLEALRAICLRGVGLEVLAPRLLTLAGLGALVLGASVLRFRKQAAS